MSSYWKLFSCSQKSYNNSRSSNSSSNSSSSSHHLYSNSNNTYHRGPLRKQHHRVGPQYNRNFISSNTYNLQPRLSQ